MLESRDNLIDNRDLKMAEVWPSLVLAHDCIVCYHYLVTSILADIKIIVFKMTFRWKRIPCMIKKQNKLF